MNTTKRIFLGLAALSAAGLLAGPAAAKKARCFTSDDGYYQCDFRGTDNAGSFRITAPGYSGYALEVDQPGFAYGYVEIGGRTISLPGMYVRSSDDRACWNNPETGTKICAW